MKKHTISKSIAGLVLAMLFSCSGENLNKIKLMQEQEELPAIEVHDLNTIYSNKGQMKGHMKSKLVHIYESKEEPYYEFPEGVYVEMYNEQGELKSVIEANYAKFLNKERIWEAKYNVKAVNEKGDTLQSEHVFIYEKEERIYSDVQVQITSKDGMRIVGKDGFESNMDFTVYKFENVTGIFNVKVDKRSDSTATDTAMPIGTPNVQAAPPATKLAEPSLLPK